MENNLTAVLDNTAATKAPDRSGTHGRLPLAVYVLAGGAFLMVTSEFIIAGVLNRIAEDLQVEVATAGTLLTTFALGMVVGAPLMALATVRMSRHMTLVAAMTVFVSMHVVAALGQDLMVLLYARFVSALAIGAFWSVSAVVASSISKPSSAARAVGVVGSGGAVATALGVPLGTFFAQLVGWRGTFWVIALAAALATVLTFFLIPKTASTRFPQAAIRNELIGIRSARLWLVLVSCATVSAGVFATYSFVVPVLTGHAGVPEAYVPLLLSGFGIALVCGTLLAGRFGDIYWGRIILITPTGTTVLLSAIGCFSDAPWLTSVLFVLLGLFGLSANSLLIHLAVRFAGQSANLGSALSIAALNAGTAIGTALAGIFINSPLGSRGPLIAGATMVALTLLPATVLNLVVSRKTEPKPGL